MKITIQKLRRLYKLSGEVAVAESDVAKELKKDRERSRGQKVLITRNGKKLIIDEKVLWDEVFYLGPDSEAGLVLREKYPWTFRLSKKQREKANEFQEYIIKEFGVDYRAMKFSDHIQLIDAMIDYKLHGK